MSTQKNDFLPRNMSFLSKQAKGPKFPKSFGSLDRKNHGSQDATPVKSTTSLNEQVFSPSSNSHATDEDKFKMISRKEIYGEHADLGSDQLNLLTKRPNQNTYKRSRITNQTTRSMSGSVLPKGKGSDFPDYISSKRKNRIALDSDDELAGNSDAFNNIMKNFESSDGIDHILDKNSIRTRDVPSNSNLKGPNMGAEHSYPRNREYPKSPNRISKSSGAGKEPMRHVTERKKTDLRDILVGNKHSSVESDSPKRKAHKTSYADDELELMKKSRSTATKLSELTKILASADEEDSFLSTLKSKNVWNPALLERSSKDDSFDDKVDLSLGLNNDLEVFDEKQNNIKQQRIVKAKYKGKEYNGSFKANELTQKIKKHWNCIPEILNGKIGSRYFEYAFDICNSSKGSMLSRSDFMRIPKNRISIGFYGMKRQSFIASLIKSNFAKEIEDAASKNKTIQFWTIDSFVLHILTCEVVWRVVADDLDLSREESMNCLNNTLDYGKYITDHDSIY